MGLFQSRKRAPEDTESNAAANKKAKMEAKPESVKGLKFFDLFPKSECEFGDGGEVIIDVGVVYTPDLGLSEEENLELKNALMHICESENDVQKNGIVYDRFGIVELLKKI